MLTKNQLLQRLLNTIVSSFWIIIELMLILFVDKQIPKWNTRILVNRFVRDRKPRLNKGPSRGNTGERNSDLLFQ